jgi:flavin-dependent dehydrogenase
LFEKSRFPRHKVCGEFLSPEIGALLEPLGLWPAFLAARPARITRATFHLRGYKKHFHFSEPAFGMSRACFDEMLLNGAIGRGAILRQEAVAAKHYPSGPVVVAHGRHNSRSKGGRLFGFKAHFAGTFDEAVEMYFFDGGYVGISPAENGIVNVCGLMPEEILQSCAFRPERLFPDAVRDNLSGMLQSFDWLITGPLLFASNLFGDQNNYLAGDAMGFIDPFTGSGILTAMLTGQLAGEAASLGIAIDSYNSRCRRKIARQRLVATALRKALQSPLVESLGRWLPSSLLYRWTRPVMAP